MSYRIKLSRKAKDFVDKSEKGVKEKINCEFRNLIDFYDGKNQHVPDLKKMSGKYENTLRLRVGNIRIIFRIVKNEFVVFVINIDSRKEVYKKR